MKCPYVMKKCSKCGEWLVAYSGNFHKGKKGKYRLDNRCKTCKSIHNKELYELKRRHGRNMLTPNEIIIYKDYSEIILYDRRGMEKARTIIDIEDTERVKNYKWCLEKNQYVMSYKEGKAYKLHRFILRYEGDLNVDHINGNPLDNRKSNLRIVTHQQNCMNKGIPTNNTSGKNGVTYHKSTGKWEVRIGFNGKRIHLGTFNTFEEAVKIRERAEEKYYGNFRRK